MKIDQVQFNKQDETVTFAVIATSESFLNSIRRISMDEVPTMAIEDVIIKENDSALYDEIIAHRMGLIPIKTDLSSYRLKRGEEDDGNSACELTFNLKSVKKGLVLAGEMESSDKNSQPAYPNLPIVKLRQKQKVEIKAIAILGKGKEHAKWCPGLIYFKIKPKIDINQTKISDKQKIVDSCPLNIFELKKNSLSLVKDRVDLCHRCESCVEASKGAISLDEETKDFILTCESFGQHKANKILDIASDILKEKTEEFKKLLSEA